MSEISRPKCKVGFWGGPEYSVITLDKLNQAGFPIAFIVTSPDRPKGRNLAMSSPPAKVWGDEHGIPVFQPENLKDEDFINQIRKHACDVFVVMAYGKIIPEEILNIPKSKSLNIHPSLLPKFRGSCPIESAILNDEKKTGVTIIRMDSEMDHGPIVAMKEVNTEPWPPTADELGKILVNEGSDLLVSTLPDWADGKIEEREQDHSQATYTKKIEKEDGLINLSDDPYKNYLKIQAYEGWPSAYFFSNDRRIKITKASLADGKLHIERVIPEGK
ncbi:MAG: methionyl-tRNA formyltransferase, partial [bacterium]|nr:methionyl-tRNA formyltransferase [bacterium]